MTGLRGLDAWLTKGPPETAREDLRWYVELANPHDARSKHLGPFDTEAEAIAEAEAWVLEMRSADNSVYRDDYGYETPYSVEDDDEVCACRWTGRRRCPRHGLTEDEYDEFMEAVGRACEALDRATSRNTDDH